MKLSEVLSALASPFKTLPQATAAIEPAKATLDSVNALFTAAGLNLEQMLAGGPDALKAHLASIDTSAEVTRLTGELKTANDSLAQIRADFNGVKDSVDQCTKIFNVIGLSKTVSADAAPDAIKTAFEAHVAKQTTLALAKTGHPPAHVPAATDTTANTSPTGAELHAQWKAMKPSPDRLAFFTQHEAAITAFERAA